MIIAVRIAGMVDMPGRFSEALYRLRLGRKYSAVLVKPTEPNLKLLRILRDHIAYGDIDKETLIMLLKKRAKMTGKLDKDKKIDAEKIASELDKKSLSELGVKPFFRLHPPIGGINTKNHFPIKKGVLGDNKTEINKLVRRML